MAVPMGIKAIQNMKKMSKHLMRMVMAAAVATLSPTYAMAQAAADSVTISGIVTDYAGQPIDSCMVDWMDSRFETITEAISGRDGRYSARVHKGKYTAVAAIYLSSYEHEAAKHGLEESKRRLEFWAWNFIADRDTTLNIRYHRMEAYGIHAFAIPGAMPTFQIYVRPMSLTRYLAWQKASKDSASRHGEDVSQTRLSALESNARENRMAPPLGEARIKVWIDGEEVQLLMAQEIDEYVSSKEKMKAYYLTVDRPKRATTCPYHVFKVEITDLKNGDRGEGLYYLEK